MANFTGEQKLTAAASQAAGLDSPQCLMSPELMMIEQRHSLELCALLPVSMVIQPIRETETQDA